MKNLRQDLLYDRRRVGKHLVAGAVMILATSITLLLCLSNVYSAYQPQPEVAPANFARATEWRQEVDRIVKDLRAHHPDPFTKVGSLTFLREAEALKAALPSLTEEQRVVRAMRLVASLGDGHTVLEPDNPTFAWWYPVRLYEFSDGNFVTSAHQSVVELAGAQVLEIAGRPAAEVINEARTLISGDNAFDKLEKLGAVHNAGLMKGLGYAAANGELTIKCKLRDGKLVERTLTPQKSRNNDASFDWRYAREMFGLSFSMPNDWVAAYNNLPASAFRQRDTTRPLHLTMTAPYVARALPEQQAYYVQFNQTDDTTMLSFFQQTMKEVDQVKPRRLLLDLRYNFGGDSSQVNTLLRELVKRADNQPWQDLYVLTGRKTFSAGVGLLNALLKQLPLTTVGEPPGAPLNFYGDAREIKYAVTGLRLHVSELRHQFGDFNDLGDIIPIDVPAPFSFADYVAGRDPAVDAILRGDEMRSIPIIAAKDGGALARKVYKERNAKFAQYSWWQPPKEFDLRRVCMGQVREKRFAEALETCKLTTEIHPGIWNTWYNLGNAQRAAGQRQEAIASYRRVLEIDPSNFNGPVLRPLLAAAAASFKPAVIRYGATVAETQAALANTCKSLTARRIDPPFQILHDIKDKQMQLDCDGFPFQGKPRWAEFIFADDSLEMVWIMTTAEEEQSMLQTMTALLGAPTHRNRQFVALTKERAALRLDKPEVLFYSEKLAPRLLPWFGPNSTFR